MTVIEWEPRFELGIPLIDEQHKVLIHLINQMESILTRGTKAQYSTVFAELVKYTRIHFTTEESLMLVSGYELDEINAHIKQHKLFIEELSIVCEDTSMISDNELEVILSFLNNWLTNHICKVDKKLAKHISLNASFIGLNDEITHKSGTNEMEIDYKNLMGYFHKILKTAEDEIKSALFNSGKLSQSVVDTQITQALKKISLVRKAVGRLSLSR